MEVSKYRINPYNTKYTGSHDYNKCRSNALADSSGSGNRTVHKGTECIGESHNPDSMHTSCDNGWFCGKQRQEWAPKEEECSSEKQACTERISKCYEIAFFHSFFIPGSPVLAHETGTGHIEGKHNIVNQIVCIRSGSISGNHDRIKGVDYRIEQKGLQSRRSHSADPMEHRDKEFLFHKCYDSVDLRRLTLHIIIAAH